MDCMKNRKGVILVVHLEFLADVDGLGLCSCIVNGKTLEMLDGAGSIVKATIDYVEDNVIYADDYKVTASGVDFSKIL